VVVRLCATVRLVFPPSYLFVIRQWTFKIKTAGLKLILSRAFAIVSVQASSRRMRLITLKTHERKINDRNISFVINIVPHTAIYNSPSLPASSSLFCFALLFVPFLFFFFRLKEKETKYKISKQKRKQIPWYQSLMIFFKKKRIKLTKILIAYAFIRSLGDSQNQSSEKKQVTNNDNTNLSSEHKGYIAVIAKLFNQC